MSIGVGRSKVFLRLPWTSLRAFDCSMTGRSMPVCWKWKFSQSKGDLVAQGKKESAQGKQKKQREKREPGFLAKTNKKTLRTYEVGAMPIINHILRRMRLSDILMEFLPNDERSTLPTYRTVMVMVKNILIAREPIYGIGQWAARFAPDLLNLFPDEVELLNDDRAGRALTQMFDALASEMTMTVVRQVIDKFNLGMDELHNDSTSISVYGQYDRAEEEHIVRGQQTLAITFGHSKDHRPDLKQLLFILTVTNDGGVPVYFTAASGNTSDDTTHRDTWDLLCQLAGRTDFLYVADCKLASSENLKHIARKGRFITVLPRSRKEDKQFRKQLLEKPNTVRWEDVYTVTKKVTVHGVKQDVEDNCFRVVADEKLSSDGYRLLWFHSTKKTVSDVRQRTRDLQRAEQELLNLRDRLSGARTRFKTRQAVHDAVQEILKKLTDEKLLVVKIEEREEATFRQAGKGRPNKDTKYIKNTKIRFEISWSIDDLRMAAAEATDGIFPLITNVKEMTAEEILRAYKRQPIIEKRFSQLKTDFAVAPICLKSVTRIQGLMAVYFLSLIVQTLLEREIRQAMKRANLESLPLYPEERACRCPTARKVIDLFNGIQRHELKHEGETEIMVTELSSVQKQILELLGIPVKGYGLK